MKLSWRNKKKVWGSIFISPFLIGFLLFFLYPVIQSIIFSFNKLEIKSTGYQLNFVGIENYYNSLFVDLDYIQLLYETGIEIILQIPAILIFSLFIAVILNQKFRGRLIMRTIFFLPVIISTGVVAEMLMVDEMFGEIQTATEQIDELLLGGYAQPFLMELQLPEFFLEYIMNAINQIKQIIDSSAIPILIFLAGLQSVPSSLYEVADIEGATGWEKFWKVTFPLISPLLLTNIVYIIIDSFTRVDNDIVSDIVEGAWGGVGFGRSAAMAWIYFLMIIIFLILVGILVAPRVFYEE
ncbi:MAG: carbohydrate ABC transporter permease [Bacillota bacterium]